ncbi:hypothetical protein Osc1_01770 [Hominimerdicola sp. 21CYCFAH17_S]
MDSENILPAGSEDNDASNQTEYEISANEPDLSFEFNVKNDEEGEAFLAYQKKYVYKKNWIKTIGFSLLGIGLAVSAWRDPDIIMNFILLGVCAAAVAAIWFNTKKIRSSLLEALKMLEDDRYIFSLYKDKFTIETIISEEEKNSEDFQPIPPRTVEFAEGGIDVLEKDNMFVIILKKDTIYVLPKRCMTDKQIEIIKQSFEPYFPEK